MPGSFGSYVLKFDKTVPMNNVKVYLRAYTRGLNYVD